MKTFTKLSTAAILAMAIVSSCAKDNKAPKEILSMTEHSFSVNALLPGIEQEEESKGYLGSYISANWSEGDKVSVVNLTTGKILAGELSADKSGNRTTFSGSVNGTITKGDKIALFYPSFNVAEETPFGSRTMNISSQSKDASTPLVTYGSFIANSITGSFSELELDFYYLVSFLKINLANLPQSAAASKITLRNIPCEFTVSVNSEGDGFDMGTSAEKAAKGKIELSGSFTTSALGTLSASLGIMPSDANEGRSVTVTIDGDGDYMAPMASAKLNTHKYYNTIATEFEKISLAGLSDYGIYDLESGETIDIYDEFNSTLITGKEDGKADFTMLNTSKFSYWKVEGMPVDVDFPSSFTISIKNYGVEGLDSAVEKASVKLAEPDGDFKKVWIKVGTNLFIVRK